MKRRSFLGRLLTAAAGLVAAPLAWGRGYRTSGIIRGRPLSIIGEHGPETIIPLIPDTPFNPKYWVQVKYEYLQRGKPTMVMETADPGVPVVPESHGVLIRTLKCDKKFRSLVQERITYKELAK